MHGRMNWQGVKNYRFNSVFMKNFALIFFAIVIPFAAISVVVFQYLDSAAQSEASRANLSIAQNIRDTFNTVLRENDRIGVNIVSDTQVEWLMSVALPEYPDYATMEKYNGINRQLRVSSMYNHHIASIYLYSELNDMVFSSVGSSGKGASLFPDHTWLDDYQENKAMRGSWTKFRQETDAFGTKSRMMTSYRMAPLYDTQKLGLVAINVSIDKLESLQNGYEGIDGAGVYIVDEAGTILYHWNQALVGTNVSTLEFGAHPPDWAREGAYFATLKDSAASVAVLNSAFGWRILSVIPMRELGEQTRSLKHFVTYAFLVMLVIMVFVVFIISRHIYRPIADIMSILRKTWMEDAGLTAGGRLNELKYIITNILSSITKGEQMERELENKLNQLRKAQEIALQAQINPHFLFNTLETVNWMAMNALGVENDVSSVIAALSQLLRISFSTETNLVPVETELEHAKCYADIQKIRYKELFNVIWEVDEAVKAYKTAKLVLQPLIENAIYHGLKPKAGGGQMRITGRVEKDCLVFSVMDDGVGMSPEALRGAQERLDSHQISGDHIGLANVHRRIRLIFGEAYGIELESAPGIGTTVLLRMPLHHIEREGDNNTVI